MADGVFYLRIAIPENILEQCKAKHAEHKKVWPILGMLHEYFYTIPDAALIGSGMSRCEGFDLACERPWFTMAIDTFEQVDDETKVLLLLKYDMSDQPHRIK